MKTYALLLTFGKIPGFRYETHAVTRADSIEAACGKFRVTPTPERGGYCRKAIRPYLPLPPKAENPEFLQVEATTDSASETGHILTIPAVCGAMINVGTWVCELPVIE